jgi:hypothetical protein
MIYVNFRTGWIQSVAQNPTFTAFYSEDRFFLLTGGGFSRLEPGNVAPLFYCSTPERSWFPVGAFPKLPEVVLSRYGKAEYIQKVLEHGLALTDPEQGFFE